MNSNVLLSLTEPWFSRVIASHSALTDFLFSFQRDVFKQGVVRWLRGKQMSTTEGVFNEFAAALQFPYYFGGNWAAFDECLADLSWIPASGYVITVFDSTNLLIQEDPTQLDQFLDLLEFVCVEWSKPVNRNEVWDRPGIPFHVIFHNTPEESSKVHQRIASIPTVTTMAD